MCQIYYDDESLKETYPYTTFIDIFVEIEPTSAME